MVYNYYDLRKARHMVSPDGIKNWKDLGIAYDPTTNFIRYTDGTVNHWYKLERAAVFMENGHVSAFTSRPSTWTRPRSSATTPMAAR